MTVPSAGLPGGMPPSATQECCGVVSASAVPVTADLDGGNVPAARILGGLKGVSAWASSEQSLFLADK